MTTKPWSDLFDRENLSDTDNAQIMVLDTTFSPSDENQRSPVTQILRSGKNLSDLSDDLQSRINIGLGNVDNTSDLNKPVSIDTQTALNSKQSSTVIDTQSNILAIPSPSLGQLGATTDTGQLLFYNGTSWSIAA